MKTIGLLGGMSWESTAAYYQIINTEIKKRLGGLHSAKVIVYSVDFGEIEPLQRAGNWPATARTLSQAAESLQAGGADCLVICTNTMHKVAGEIAQHIDIPLLHIADATAAEIHASGHACVGLLGTRFTMADAFYRGRLTDRFGIDVVVPDKADQDVVHDVIYEELCRGDIRESSRKAYLQVIGRLAEQGAGAVILGCTEISLLVQQAHTVTPLFDTTRIHALEAVNFSLS